MPRYRGNSSTFTARLVDDAGNPLEPQDPNEWPRITILDPDDNEIWTATPSGIGVSPVAQGEWMASWYIPVDATLTADGGPKWRAVWRIVDVTGREYVAEDRFEVQDSPYLYDLGEPDELFYLAMAGTTERLFFRTRTRAEDISVRVSDSLRRAVLQTCSVHHYDDEGSVQRGQIVENLVETPETDPSCPPDIQEPFASGVGVGSNQMWVYYIDTPEMSVVGDYLVLWSVRQNELTPTEHVTQVLRVPDDVFWMVLPSLSLLIDKIQKPLGTSFGFTDAMMHEWLLRGIGAVNGVFPPTNWTLSQTMNTYGMLNFVLLGAAVWGLTSQGIMEVDQAFDFSGQTITLNHQRDYDGVISRMADELSKLEQIKQTVYRRSVPLGSMAIRYMGFRQTNQPEMMTAHTGPMQESFGMMVRLGLM